MLPKPSLLHGLPDLAPKPKSECPTVLVRTVAVASCVDVEGGTLHG